MAYILGSGIHFCDAGGTLVFLDVPGDRYLFLEMEAETAFRRTILEGTGETAHPALEALARHGILERVDGPQRPQPAPALSTAERSVLDRTAIIKPSPISIAKAAVALKAARTSLRRKGLARTLDALARQPMDPKALFPFLKAMEFTTLTRRVAEATGTDAAAIEPAEPEE